MQTAQRVLPRAVAWPLMPLLLAGALAADLAEPGRGAGSPGADDVLLLVAMAACWVVGVVVTGRTPAPLAGWAFLGLATSVAWSAFCDEYGALGVGSGVGTGRVVPLWELAATLGDTSFAWWFVFLALVLQLTAPGPREGLARRLPLVTLLAGFLFQAMALLRSTALDPPYQDLSSPLAVPALDGLARALAAAAVYGLAGCLLASVVVLVRAWRRARGEARQQVLWLVAGAVPLVPAVIGAFAFSAAERTDLASAALGLAMTTLVVGAGLSVLRYRLYDVERVVTESAAYALASAAVLVAYLAALLVVSRSGPLDSGSRAATVAATLTGVAAARVSFVWGRRAVGRRVSPRRFQALQALRTELAQPAPDLDKALAAALGPGARVVYPAGGGTWVTAQGVAVQPSESAVDVLRHGRLLARLEFDPRLTEPAVAAAVADQAAAEVDNVALRATLARQLELIRESRARLATAHLEERQRIERDLHDGAQQRLLATALQLQSARLNGDATVLEEETGRAIAQLQAAVQELRDLAAGLQPAALAGGGLLAAVADLAVRTPVPLDYDVVDERFPRDVESAAWFVVAEAVTNAVKHSASPRVAVVVRRTPRSLCLEVRDEGSGGADPRGRGLQGLADRVAATGGSLQVREAVPCGTVVQAEFPCAS